MIVPFAVVGETHYWRLNLGVSYSCFLLFTRVVWVSKWLDDAIDKM
jgi:hypothetical protein